jgi:4-hydroxy-tetrahydrodipicolinate synthase
MSATERRGEVLAPVVTPFAADLAPDASRLVRHCRWLLRHDVDLAVFGTTSEANSLGVGEKLALLDALVEAGIPAARLMPGTGCCALPDTVELTRRAVRHGCRGVLMLPPFYYKGVSDEGLFRNFAEVIERVADDRLRNYLYHIPAVSQVPITLALIERLLARYPRVVAGVKDSSGDWNNLRAMIERFAAQGFRAFSGNEKFLLATLRAGGAGCISATANVNPGAIARLARDWRSGEAAALQQAIDRVRDAFQQFPMIGALKAAIAHFGADPAWGAVRPPLTPLLPGEQARLLGALDAIGFAMPGPAP